MRETDYRLPTCGQKRGKSGLAIKIKANIDKDG
jgi:hypothetical protein